MRVVRTVLWLQEEARLPAAGRLRLASLLPRVGSVATVFVDAAHSPPAGARVHLLWSPPYAQLLGWVGQPSEIPLSRIVTGCVRGVCRPSSPGAALSWSPGRLVEGCVRLALRVEASIPLFEALQHGAHPATAEADAGPGEDAARAAPAFDPEWCGATWCGQAQIGAFLYLAGMGRGVSLGAVLRREPVQLVSYLRLRAAPGASVLQVGRVALSASDQEVLEGCLRQARPLRDRVDYLDLGPEWIEIPRDARDAD